MSAEHHDPSLEGDDPSEVTAQVIRTAFWKSLEPTDADAELFSNRILSAARSVRRPAPARGWWRTMASIAACIALSFAAGWALHSHHVRAALAHLAPAVVSKPAAFQVTLTDDQGRVTAVQAFDSADKAQEFAHDLGQWQNRAMKLRKGTPVILADRF